MKKTNKTPRQVRWNVKSDPVENQHYFTILIVNEQRTIDRIVQKFSEAAQPIEDLRIMTSGSVPNSHGLRYALYTCSKSGVDHNSSPTLISWKRIYQGPINRDTNLYERDSPDGLSKYVDNFISKNN